MVASSIPGRVLSSNSLRQVVHTHVPLSPSSTNWYRCKSSDVNRHTTRYTSPVFVVSQYKHEVWLRAMETEISAALWAHVAGEGLYALSFTLLLIHFVPRQEITTKFVFVSVTNLQCIISQQVAIFYEVSVQWLRLCANYGLRPLYFCPVTSFFLSSFLFLA